MRTASGLFSTRDEARRAIGALEDAGIDSDDITMISSRTPTDEGPAGEGSSMQGAGVGAAVGSVGGLLAGIMAFAAPGIGPAVGAGWLVAALVGAAAGGVAGGLIGSMTRSGIAEREAHVYAEGIRRGDTLVSARVQDSEFEVAQAILSRHGNIDTEARRREYEQDGWEGFSDKDIWDDDIGSEDGEGRTRPSTTPFSR